MTKFPHLAEALKEYDATAIDRANVWSDALTTDDVWVCQRMDKAAHEKLADAFFEDTKAVNCRDNCSLVTVRDFRSLVETGHFASRY